MRADGLPPRVRTLYPFASRELDLTCGHTMHYVDEGSGNTLLMVHGNPTWSFYFRDLIKSLAALRRCIVPDHIGCGLSDKPGDWSYHIAAHADNLAELVERLDLRDVTLVVHDWGGAIGYLAALQMPERFRRFIVFNSAVFLLPLPRMLTLLRLPMLGPSVIRGLNGLVRSGFHLATAQAQRFAPAVRAGYLAPYDSWANRIALLRFVQEIPLDDDHHNRVLLRRLKQELPPLWSQPHLLVWGSRDPVFHSAYLARWREHVPGAEVHEFADASHWVVEDAHERIVPLIEQFIERTP